MNIEILVEGVAFLQQLELKPDEFLDITTFVERPVDLQGHSCGTVACALGWMAVYGKFGLMEYQDTIKLRYTLNDRWSVKAESGLEQSADFEFRIER